MSADSIRTDRQGALVRSLKGPIPDVPASQPSGSGAGLSGAFRDSRSRSAILPCITYAPRWYYCD